MGGREGDRQTQPCALHGGPRCQATGLSRCRSYSAMAACMGTGRWLRQQARQPPSLVVGFTPGKHRSHAIVCTRLAGGPLGAAIVRVDGWVCVGGEEGAGRGLTLSVATHLLRGSADRLVLIPSTKFQTNSKFKSRFCVE